MGHSLAQPGRWARWGCSGKLGVFGFAWLAIKAA